MMASILWSFIVTFLLFWSQSNAQEYYLHPERDARFVSSGDSDSTVIQPGDSLYDALRGLTSDTSLVLSSGQYQLEQYVLVSNLSDVKISGQENVVISCKENIGLVFVNMTRLVIDNVRIERCGLSGTNLDHAVAEIRQFIDLFLVVYSQMRAALLLAHCENLQMNGVELYNNVGFGVVGVNIIGSSVVSQLTAVGNSGNCYQFYDCYGGGAVFIYYNYLSEMYNSQSYNLTIEKGMFKYNRGNDANAEVYFDISNSAYIPSLRYIGGGGGLTLMMVQLNYGIQVVTQDTEFIRNIANVGSGAYVAIFSGAKNTAIEFLNCDFSYGAPLEYSSIQTGGGAGLAVITDIGGPRIEQARSSNTSIRIENSQFMKNTSPNGSGLFYYSLYKSQVEDKVYLLIKNCTFQDNVAYSGSAMQLSELKYYPAFVGTQLEVIDTNIIGNKITTANFEEEQSIQQDNGIIDLHYLNMTFKGNCFISKNSGTGLKAVSSYVGIDGNITFSENNALRGGAMFLSTLTWLIVLPNASLYLLNNNAREAGGAIYSIFQNVSTITGDESRDFLYQDCFLAFSFNDIGPCVDCSDLNKTGSLIKFEGNSAPAGGLVFGSSFENCYWLRPNNFTFLLKTFPNVFSVDAPVIRPEYFQTQAKTLNALGPMNTTKFIVLPGQVFNITFTARDNFDQIVSRNISSFIQASLELTLNATFKIGQNNYGVLDNRSTKLPVRVTGEQGQNFTVVFYIADSIEVARTAIDITLGHCGIGYVFDNDSLSCMCLPRLARLGFTCNEESLELVKNQNNLWIGQVDDVLGAVDCSLEYCYPSASNTILLVEGEPNFDAQCDPSLYRTGVACGDCQEGQSLMLGTWKCMKCSNFYGFLFILFIALGILLISVLYFIDMNIDKGLLNGAIFFSNLVILYKGFLFPGSPTYVIDFLSLNFGFEVCLYDGMDVTVRIVLQFVFVVYLFVLILFIVFFAKIVPFKCRKNFQHNRLSAVKTISTLLLLCYVSILQVIGQLIGYVDIQKRDGNTTRHWLLQPSVHYLKWDENGLRLVWAILLIILFVLPFTFLLLFPKLAFKSKYLTQKLKPFYDSFLDPFKLKYRWWLGFRLIYRWVPLLLADFVTAPTNLFVTALLLLVLLFLQLQLKPFKNYWINLLDSAFIGMLVAMFMGTQFFKHNNDVSTETNGNFVFNLVIILLASLLYLGIFAHHVKIRFPNLGVGLLNAWSKIRSVLLRKKFSPKESKEKKDESKEKSISVATFSEVVAMELREPLLDDDVF